MSKPAHDVFISYASQDRTIAEEVHRRFREAGFSVWFDLVRLQPGFDWHREIEAACESSRVVIPVLTPRWKLSEWTRFETYGAEVVIPLIVEGRREEIFTPPLTKFQGIAVNVGVESSSDEEWNRVFDAVRNVLSLPMPDKQERLIDVRYQANPYFVGREKELLAIHEALHQNPTVALTQARAQAIAALGGVGKTTLARQYLEKFWRCYKQIVWVDCRLGVQIEFARVCDLLSPEYRKSSDIREKAKFALRALAARDDSLIVLDNALDEESIQEWIPKAGSCRTLITSRFAAWSPVVGSIHLYVLDPESARTLLTKRSGNNSFASLSTDDQNNCTRLADQLGYLPLALEQAAAYIQQQEASFGFADYLRLYEVAKKELLDKRALGSNEYPDSVITTWRTTTSRLSPGARAILRLCAFISPAPLPVSVLIEGADVVREEAAALSHSSNFEKSQQEVWVREQIQQLRAYSMIEGVGKSIAVHLLVQTVERLQLEDESGTRSQTLLRSIKWIDRAFDGEPVDVRSWPLLDVLSPHVRTVIEFANVDPISKLRDRLLGKLDVYRDGQECMVEFDKLMTTAPPTEKLPYTDDELKTLAELVHSINALVDAQYSSIGWVQTIDEQSDHEYYFHVSTLLNSLALVLLRTERPLEAEKLLRRALELDERAYGEDDPLVARDLSNLAMLLYVTKHLSDAVPLLLRALKFYCAVTRATGHKHPQLMKTIGSVGFVLGKLNRSVDEVIAILVDSGVDPAWLKRNGE